MVLTRLLRQFEHIAPLAAICLVALFISGCGYDGREPAYDCDRNPNNFPEVAVDFLRGVEGGYVRTADEITGRFASLYTAHPSLLSDKSWREVTRRLGIRLHYRADRLVQDGLLQFSQAADYYAIASQTDPADTTLADKARLFSTWREASADSTFDIPRLADSDNLTPEVVTFKLATLRRFALRDDLHLRFAQQHLAAALFPVDIIDQFKASDAAADLPPADCALLACLGLMNPDIDTAVARFRQPEIEVPAVRVTPLASDSARIEIYFLPRQSIPADLRISLWVETPDSMLPPEKQPRFPFDFVPAHPSTTWAEGHVTAVIRHISFHYPISAVLLGLYDTASGRPVFLGHDGPDGDRVRIEIPLDSVRQRAP